MTRRWLAALATSMLLGPIDRAAADDAAAAGPESCIEIESAATVLKGLGCLNANLAHQAQARHARVDPDRSSSQAQADAPSSSLGLFNEAATAERLGSAFGHSAIPQRPPAPVYSSPIIPPAPR